GGGGGETANPSGGEGPAGWGGVADPSTRSGRTSHCAGTWAPSDGHEQRRLSTKLRWRNVNFRADLPPLSTATRRPRRSSAGKVRHHLAREQQHRRLGLGATDHAEIHLQRR